MSFRGRLTLFLLLIVALPMVVIAVLASRIADDALDGKADARLFAGLETATALFEEKVAEGRSAAEAVASDPGLAQAIRAGDASGAQELGAQLARGEGIESLRVRSAEGEELASIGPQPFAAAQLDLSDDGERIASLTASVVTEADFVREVERLTGRQAATFVDGQDSVQLSGESVNVPGQGGANVSVDGNDQRVLSGELPDSEGHRIALFGPAEEGGFFSSSPAVAAALAVFFAIAILFALAVMRSLSRQVAEMHDAAKRIGGGDFSQKVPVRGGGRDELAGLAQELNRMSDRLSDQMEQLRRQQIEIDRSVRRIGEAFAAGLDREGLLQIVAETAVSACSAEYGLVALSGREGAEVSAGRETEEITDAVLAAETVASRSDEAVERSSNGAHALSAPLRRISDPEHALGVMTVARSGVPFTPAERDVFLYLIGQASASIENVALHELVSEQAVTDELTGIANKRSFVDRLDKEAARVERFGHTLSLVMLDIDNFKQVNDRYGHLVGDEVLRRVGRILRDESRGIDLPARYGGEEFAVALPETGPEGADEFAERVRRRIAAEEVALPDRGPLRFTASVGVASMPGSADDVGRLVAAADTALYRAKREGKNRVVVAPSRVAEAASAGERERRG